MVHVGGPAFFAASTVLPLQVPVRIGNIMRALIGRKGADPLARGAAGASRLPAGVAPEAVRFTRRPDVVFLVAESLPGDHLDARTMPNLWRRGASGARYPNHYSGASNTEYGMFSLIYGLQASKLETIVGGGRQPLLFPALRANGYRMRVLASSCIDWMSLKETVFGGVQDVLQTWCDGTDARTVDAEMLESAKTFVAGARADEPLFLFLFFFGTHFNYYYEPQDREFSPEWDGQGGLKVTTEAGWKIENRARNAARTLDRRIEGFLSAFEAARGRAPLVFFTGDHGEEFREKGRIGHGSQVTREQVHVPALWLGPGTPPGVFEAPTSHADVVPTLFSLLGDGNPPEQYSDGMSMFRAPSDRFVVVTVGWEPQYAIIGKDVKVHMYAGSGAQVTDTDDRPLPDGSAQLARHGARMVRALRGEPDPKQ
jgi:membrane-anchored protein YejM (alkaline phosphatase superfamily)